MKSPAQDPPRSASQCHFPVATHSAFVTDPRPLKVIELNQGSAERGFGCSVHRVARRDQLEEVSPDPPTEGEGLFLYQALYICICLDESQL